MKISVGEDRELSITLQRKPEPIKFTPVEKPERKPRCDKKVKFTLRLQKDTDDHLKAIAYNHDTSKQQVIDRILKMVLESEQLRDKLIASMPKGSQKYTYFVGEGLFRK